MKRVVMLKPLDPGAGVREVELPIGTVVLGVTKKSSQVCLVCDVDPDQETREKYRFQQLLTGQEIESLDSDYVGTVEIEEQLTEIPRGVIVPANIDPKNITQVMWVHVFMLEMLDENSDDVLDSSSDGLLGEKPKGRNGA